MWLAEHSLGSLRARDRNAPGLLPFCRIGIVREIDGFVTYLSLTTEMGVVFHDVNVRHQATNELNLFAVNLFKKKYKDIFEFSIIFHQWECRYLQFSLYDDQSIPHSKYCGWWWPEDAKIHEISSTEWSWQFQIVIIYHDRGVSN